MYRSLLLTAILSVLQDVYLVHILNELAGNSFMVFCGTCNTTLRLSLLLNALGLPVGGTAGGDGGLIAIIHTVQRGCALVIGGFVQSW